MSKKPKDQVESAIADFTEADIPKNITPAERAKVVALIKQPSTTFHDNSAMLSDIKNKKYTTEDRIKTLFIQQNFSPITRLIRLVKIEEAKMEAWNRAIMAGLEPHLLEFMPKPDKKFYANLLLQLVRFEVPERKAVEVSGQIEAGMTVTIHKHVPLQRLVKIDGKSPDKLKQLHGSSEEVLTEKPKAVAVEVVVDDYA